MNIFWKIEEDCLKIEGDRFLVIFKISKKIDLEKIEVHASVLKTLERKNNFSNIEQDF